MSQYLPRLAVVKDHFIWLHINTNLHHLYTNFSDSFPMQTEAVGRSPDPLEEMFTQQSTQDVALIEFSQVAEEHNKSLRVDLDHAASPDP